MAALTVDVAALRADVPWLWSARFVEAPSDSLAAVAELRDEPWVAFDCETAGEMFDRDFELLTVAVAGPGTEDPFVWERDALADPLIRAPLARLLADPSVRKGGHNVKFDMLASRLGCGVVVHGVRFDTMLGRRLLESDALMGLETCQELVGMGGGKEEMRDAIAAAVASARSLASSMFLFRDGPLDDPRNEPHVRAIRERETDPRAHAFALVDPTLRGRYCAIDALSTARLRSLQERQLRAHRVDLGRLWREVGLPVLEAFEQVEAWGVAVDRDAVERFYDFVTLRLQQLEAALSGQVEDPDLNWDSPAQVADLLYGRLGLPVLDRTEKGSPSVSKSTLARMAAKHPIVRDLLEYGRVKKQLTAYAAPLRRWVRPDGRIHAQIKQGGARTGRISIENPALQTIPRDKDSDEGRMARSCFVAPAGRLLLSLDYSQIEIRVAAYLSGDAAMIDILRRGVDYHRATAALVYRIAEAEVTKKQRSAAKAINFGLLYGMSDHGLAAGLGIGLEEAAEIRQAVLGSFPGFAAWSRRMLSECRRTGISRTYWRGAPARIRQMWRIADEDDAARSSAERSVVNTPVQGTANELCLDALARVVRWIWETGDDSKVVLTVHDSILLEVAADRIQEVGRVVRRIMEDHDLGDVPVVVDAEVGPSWGALDPLEDPDVAGG